MRPSRSLHAIAALELTDPPPSQVWTTLNSFGKNTRIYTPMPLVRLTLAFASLLRESRSLTPSRPPCRPQYHSTAAILAVGVAWNARATVVIGRKFSATTFWRDVRESRANVVQYVGEGASLVFLVHGPLARRVSACAVTR